MRPRVWRVAPEYVYRAPYGEDVVAIYSKIAVEIPCPAEQSWGKR